MKKLFSVIIAVTIMFSSFVAVRSENEMPPIIDDSSLQIITVLLDGEPIKFDDVAPVIVGDRTLVPFRAIFEALEYEVDWNEDTYSITALNEFRTINMQIGRVPVFVFGDDVVPNDNADRLEIDFDSQPGIPAEIKNGTPYNQIDLDVPPQIIGYRTFVPVRAVAELSNYDVQWDEKTYTVIITTPADEEEAGNTDDTEQNSDSLKYHIEYDDTNEISSSRAKNFEIIDIDKNDDGDYEITYTVQTYRDDSGNVIVAFNCLDETGRRIGGFSDMFHSWAYSWTPQEGTAVIPGNTVKIELAKDE